MSSARSSTGHLVPDPVKFPDGIKGTADYVHSLGLKLGIYEDAGTLTCAGYPGSYGHETTDAQDFAVSTIAALPVAGAGHFFEGKGYVPGDTAGNLADLSHAAASFPVSVEAADISPYLAFALAHGFHLS